jgi:peroxiredoxin
MRFQSIMEEIGTPAPPFSIADPSGRLYTLDDFRDARGLLVAFICNHCPFVLHILDRFVALTHEYQARGIATVAISSNDIGSHPEDGPQQMAQLARQRHFGWPYLYDESQQAARQFRAACTPDLFLYGPDRRLYYRGRFDGTRPTTVHTVGKPGAGLAPTGADLRSAFDSLLAGNPPPSEQYPSMGCSMKWKPGLEPEWS